MYIIDMASCSMISNFMKIGTDVQEILRLFLRDCNVGITDVRDLWITLLRWG
jgi:hypothetical protein